MSREEKFQIPSNFNGDRKILEFTMMAQFIVHNKEEIQTWIDSKNEEKVMKSLQRFLEFLEEEQLDYSESILGVSEDLKNILHSFNYGSRLNIGQEGDLLQLQRLESGTPYVI